MMEATSLGLGTAWISYSKMVGMTFLYTHVLDFLEWGLIGPGEAEQMAGGLIRDRYLQDKCP